MLLILVMNFLVFFVTGLEVALASSMPPLTEENNCSGIKNDRSLLSSLLTVTGFSDTCVAAALDFCSTGQDDSRYASLMEEARGVVQQASAVINEFDAQLSEAVNKSGSQLSAAVDQWESQVSAAITKLESHISATANKSESRPRHCKDLKDSGDTESGLRYVYPYPDHLNHRMVVFCNHSVDGGGWTVFQRRNSDVERQDFFRTFIEYQLGFGSLHGEFFLGLDLLHQLTSISLQELRVDLDDYEGEHRWAKYRFFHVGGPETKYRLSIRNYSGNAGDSLVFHNGQPFSTHDADNDNDKNRHCAEIRRGAWWYKDCFHSNLNGYQYVGNDTPDYRGIAWKDWRGYTYSLKRTSMMIRPAF